MKKEKYECKIEFMGSYLSDYSRDLDSLIFWNYSTSILEKYQSASKYVNK